MSDRIDPGAPLSVTLRAQSWNTVMAMMSEGMSSLIAEMQRQCMQQTQHAEHMPPMRQPARPNGEAVADG